MKRTISLILAMLMVSIAWAGTTSRQIIKATDSNDDIHHYYYNAQNQLFWELFGTTRREYTYNAQGQKAAITQYAWVAADGNYTVSMTEAYTYDAAGNMTEMQRIKSPGTAYETTWTYKYSDFVNGVATYYDEYKNGNLYYMYKQVSEFDAANRQTSCTVYYADPDDYAAPTHETVSYDDEDYKYSKTYDADGYLVHENDGKATYDYIYAELGADYAPANLVAALNNGVVTLTWDAVPGAEKYIVSYDQKRVEVTACTATANVGIGNRLFTVQAVIGDIERNAAAPVSAVVVDAGNLPITDLAVGTIYKTVEETESEELTTRTFYNIPLTWTLPAGHSEIVKFNIYYNSAAYGDGTYVSLVNNPNATSYTLKVDPFEMANRNAEGELVSGIETPIYVTIVYVSGESEKSNIVMVNPFDLLEKETSITSVSSPSATSSASYSLSGQRISGTARGIVIRNGKKMLVK